MNASKFKEQGDRYLQLRKFPEALGFYSLAILHKMDGDLEANSVTYACRAQTHMELLQYTRALSDAQSAFQLLPENQRAYYIASKAALALGRFDEAKRLCDKGIQLLDTVSMTDLAIKIQEEKVNSEAKRSKAKVEQTSKDHWYNLPGDLLSHIARRFHSPGECLIFGRICRPWWRVALVENRKNMLPWILLPEIEESDRRRFYSPFDDKMYNFNLPELQGARCWGSPHNWLVIVDLRRDMRLLDLFSHSMIPLPELHKCQDFKDNDNSPYIFRDESVYRVALSSHPLSADCMVLAAFRYGHLKFTKPGDDGWRSLHYESEGYVEDAMYFGGKFYVILNSGEVVICDSNGNFLEKLSLTTLVEAYERKERVMTYILEIDGRIFVIARHICVPNSRFAKTLSFKAYKLDADGNEWEEVNTLGDWSVFVGNNHSFGICGSENSKFTKNCVYFTDELSEYAEESLPGQFNVMELPFPEHYDIGVFCFDTGAIQTLIELEFSNTMDYFLPVWIRPDLEHLSQHGYISN